MTRNEYKHAQLSWYRLKSKCHLANSQLKRTSVITNTKFHITINKYLLRMTASIPEICPSSDKTEIYLNILFGTKKSTKFLRHAENPLDYFVSLFHVAQQTVCLLLMSSTTDWHTADKI